MFGVATDFYRLDFNDKLEDLHCTAALPATSCFRSGEFRWLSIRHRLASIGRFASRLGVHNYSTQYGVHIPRCCPFAPFTARDNLILPIGSESDPPLPLILPALSGKLEYHQLPRSFGVWSQGMHIFLGSPALLGNPEKHPRSKILDPF